jgi:hypothetical protein
LKGISNMILLIRKLSLAAVFACSTLLVGCGGDVLSSEELVSLFPEVGPESTRAENTDILCPFQRMLKRSGLYDNAEDGEATSLKVKTGLASEAAEVFGCDKGSCGSIITLASIAQWNLGKLDLSRLHEAGSLLSHDCGLTFEFGGTSVSDSQRQFTLDRLLALANTEGQLQFDDLITVKQEICESQGVEMTVGGETEVKLIYAYLGGVERSFIDHSDVVRLLHATMPAYKTSAMVDLDLIGQVQ